jgi:N-methylhydantoinase A
MDRLHAMIKAQVGGPLGLGADQAAAAVIRIANDRMAGAIRMVSLARGHDPRDFALFAFGGAGPLHAVALARELAIPKVLIPARPGLTNALGCAAADVRHDFVRTVNRPLPEVADDLVQHVLAEQIAEGRATIERERVAVERIDFVHRADMQFQGQSHILTVALPGLDVPRDALQRLFEAAYWQRFEVELKEIRPVLVNLHTAAIGRRRAVSLEAVAQGEPRASLRAAEVERRSVWFDGGWRDTPVYRRERLPAGTVFDGPAVIEQLDCTALIEPGCRVERDRVGNLLVTV